MHILLATDDGVYGVDEKGTRPAALRGLRVTHVACRDGSWLATVRGDGAYLDGKRVFEGDTRSCAIGPDGALWVGVEPAMVFCSRDGGASWSRCDAIDALPTRAAWTFPPPPHQPHVLSIDFLAGDSGSVVAGVEVGGALLSPDGGRSWREINAGLYPDVHSLRPDPSRRRALYAVTGRGFYASENDGESWERRMAGVERGYTIGLAVRPGYPGEVMIASGQRPPGLDARVYHTRDAGKHWVELAGSGLPDGSGRAPVPFFASGSAWLGTGEGELLRAEDPLGSWSCIARLPVPINAAASDGMSSSVMH